MVASDAPGATALPAADQLSTTGFATLVDRLVSVFCLATLVPLVASGYEQLRSLDARWLAVVGGTLVATSVLMPLYAWNRRGIRRLAGLYAAVVLLACATWPLAWRTPAVAAANAPALWVPLGLAPLCLEIAAGRRIGAPFALLLGLVFCWVRTTASGGAAPLPLAVTDAAVGVAQPAAVLLAANHFKGALARLDAAVARDRFETADAEVSRALEEQRRRLDALIHDEVMTTLVAAARSGDAPDPHVARQAREAIAALRAEADAGEHDGTAPSAEQLVRLVKDVVASVCPQAQVLGEIPGAATQVPAEVVRTLLRATREAALNAGRHAEARHVQVLVQVSTTARRVLVRVSVADDGRGFDPSAVAPERLGLRLAVRERMAGIGGRADVIASPGRGTTVRLSWSGERVRVGAPRHRTRPDATRHPLYAHFRPRTPLLAGAAIAVLYVVLGLIALPAVAHPPLMVAALLVLVGGLAGATRTLARPPVPRGRGWLLAGLAVAGAALGRAGLDGAPWPEHGTWFVTLVVLLLGAVYASGSAAPAWAGGFAHALLVGEGGLRADLPLGRLLVVSLMPLAVLAMLALMFWWLDGVWAELDDAAAAAGASARVDAASFSKLVLREVWLAELRARVGPMLVKIADAAEPLTQADRATCLLLEGGLRDEIKAANFHAPALAAEIMDARRRGVQVTLVDNRGSRLPEAARRAALPALERAVRSAEGGRVVARTAPEGYPEAVTILSSGGAGASDLIRIGVDGSLRGAAPTPPAATESES